MENMFCPLCEGYMEWQGVEGYTCGTCGTRISVTPGDNIWRNITTLTKVGLNLQAIKTLRAATHISLRDAKRLIEAFQTEMAKIARDEEYAHQYIIVFTYGVDWLQPAKDPDGNTIIYPTLGDAKDAVHALEAKGKYGKIVKITW